MKMDWTGRESSRALFERLAGNLHAFDDVILDKAREVIGIEGPPRSLPGEAPHIDSGRLIESLYDEVDAGNLRSRIGSSEEHAAYLEEGTEDMEARPWLLPSIIESSDDAARELAR